MGKFDGILICTDLDGTLYNSERRVSQENREAIDYFKREGGLFTFITGRMPYYATDAYRAASPNVPFGCVNGGGVYDGERGEYIFRYEMSRKALPLVDFALEAFPAVGIQVATFDVTYFSKENEVMRLFREITGIPNLTRAYREVDEPIAKIILGLPDEAALLAMQRAIAAHPGAQDFTVVRSEQWFIEILPKAVHKGLALGELIGHLGVDPRKTVAIGDYNNDVGMLRAAGLGVAVANACPAAIEAADTVTVSNDEHAIARVIYDLDGGRLSL